MVHNGIGCFIIGGLLAPAAARRWRWSLLIVGVMLLLALTVLMSYLLDFIKGEFALFLLSCCNNRGMKPFVIS